MKARQSDEQGRAIRFLAGRKWLLTIPGIVVVIGLWLLLRPGVNVEEELAAIDAAHAVPAGENAAEDYAALVSDTTISPPNPLLLPDDVRELTLAQPWRAADQSEAAQWIEDHRVLMDRLMQASRKPKCWFRVSHTEWPEAEYFVMEYQGAMLLLRAANNDLGEGRIEAALEKLRCVLQIARHLCSQMRSSEVSAGWAITEEAMRTFDWIVVSEDIPAEWRGKLKTVLPPVEDMEDEHVEQWKRIASLYVRKRHTIKMRLLYALSRIFVPTENAIRQSYRRHLGASRAGRILFALRRHKDTTGTWPTNLSEIESALARQTFIDPFSGRQFIYHRVEDSFCLYSPGSNGVDEGGASGDDRSFWPR